MTIANPESNFVAFIGGVFLGLILGFVLRGFIDTKRTLEPSQAVLYTVLIIFSLSMFIQLFIDPTRETSPLLYTLMGAVVGFFFTPLGSKRKK